MRRSFKKPPKYSHNSDKGLKARAQASQLRSLHGNQSSIQSPATLGEIASHFHIRPIVMISMFAKAGVHGLTPNHIILQSQTESLLSYIRTTRAQKANQVFDDRTPVEPKIVIIQNINARLLQQLASRPQLMHSLDPRKFEELTAQLLEDQGCEVTLTKRTRDGGYDIFGRMKAGPADFIFLAECKRYSPENKVGVEIVRGLYGVTESRKANLGLIITTSSFTKDAVEEKLRIGPRIGLKEFSDLCDWLGPYKTSSE